MYDDLYLIGWEDGQLPVMLTTNFIDFRQNQIVGCGVLQLFEEGWGRRRVTETSGCTWFHGWDA